MKRLQMNLSKFLWLSLSLTVALAAFSAAACGEERSEHFDRDPGWEAHNNRPAMPVDRLIKQDFGYEPSSHHVGDLPGEIGGLLTPAAEPAYYAKKIPQRTIADKLSASGKFAFDGQGTHFLLGFFNGSTLNEWRTPNTIALRISVRGDKFLAWLEYCTDRWRAGGDDPLSFPTAVDPKSGKRQLKGFPTKGVHTWSLEYDPAGNDGKGLVTATIDGESAKCNFAADHRADGGTFNQFGLLNVMKSADGGGGVWLDDVTIGGRKEDFRHEPGWEGMNNRRSYSTTIVRPKFDFGFSPTHFAGGQASGELGGLIFRGDCRYPDRMASYGDRLDELHLDKPLKASGHVSMRRGVTDSTVLIGFFHATDSMAVNSAQNSVLPKCFLGVSTDGPSREGFFFNPVYRNDADGQGQLTHGQAHLYPDGQSQEWSLEYDPKGADGRGEIVVKFAEQTMRLPLKPGHKSPETRFNRFGIITTWIDGNSQTIFFDDLTYTFRQ